MQGNRSMELRDPALRERLRRELLRFRDVVAALYLEDADGDPVTHRQAARCLHRLDARVARQLDD